MNLPVNGLYHSDALTLLERIDSGRITLVYLDPPLCTTPGRRGSPGPDAVREWRALISHSIQQTRRVLCDVGSVFLHADPGQAGWIRLLLDEVFGSERFLSEIIWPHRHPDPYWGTGAHSSIYVYSVSDTYIYNPQPRHNGDLKSSGVDGRGRYRLTSLLVPVDRQCETDEWSGVRPPKGYSWRFSTERLQQMDEKGLVLRSNDRMPRYKAYLPDDAFPVIGNLWDDLPGQPPSNEDLRPASFGQQPKVLLERIIRMASSEGDLILDPFCGTGTALVVAQDNGRQWIGCDKMPRAIELAEQRLNRDCGLVAGTDYASLDDNSLRTLPGVSCEYLEFSRPTLRPLEQPTKRFVYDTPMESDETRHYEYKEVTSAHPVDAIKNTADEYAVAFLNCGGGRIFWGVRNADKHVVGVHLSYQQRDEVRCKVVDKLGAITPSLDPTQYRTTLYPVEMGPENDLYVVELVVPDTHSTELYFTGGGEAWAKTDSGKRKLNGAEINAWFRSRLPNAQTEVEYGTSHEE